MKNPIKKMLDENLDEVHRLMMNCHTKYILPMVKKDRKKFSRMMKAALSDRLLAKRQKAIKVKKNFLKSHDIPIPKGTERQIIWATCIKYEFAQRLCSEKMWDSPLKKMANDYVLNCVSSGWLIKNRANLISSSLNVILGDINGLENVDHLDY